MLAHRALVSTFWSSQQSLRSIVPRICSVALDGIDGKTREEIDALFDGTTHTDLLDNEDHPASTAGDD
jgi:hypothetical protein